MSLQNVINSAQKLALATQGIADALSHADATEVDPQSLIDGFHGIACLMSDVYECLETAHKVIDGRLPS
jgi:hypothetical protein